MDNAVGSNIVGSLSAYNFDGKGPTLTVGDTISGTAGSTNNTLTLVDGYNQGVDIVPAGVSISNIQTVSLTTAGNAGVAGNPFNTSPYSSVTSTTVTSSGGAAAGDVVQASGTSAISVTHNSTVGPVTTYGGSDTTVTTSGTGGVTVGGNGLNQLPAATGTVTVNANGTGAGAGTVTVMGGKNVNVTVSTASSTGNINIGNTALGALTAADNPTGAITVTSNSLNGAGNTETIMGGTTVNVSAMGDNITVGDAAATTASNEPTGNVTVSDMMPKAYDNLTGPGTSHNATLGGVVMINGGANVSVTTNTGAGVAVGATGVAATYPTGTVAITDTSSNLNGAFGIGGAAGGASVAGGTIVTVTEAGGGVQIGASLGAATDNPSGAVTVTETVASQQNVIVDGGNGVTVSAQGQGVYVGTNSGTAGAQSITQSSVYSGNALGSTNVDSRVVDEGGTTVTVNTTGGNVYVGNAATATPTGAVSITNTFSGTGGANNSLVAVLGGSTVSITETNTTNNTISVGAAPVLNSGGTALNAATLASEPTGNVTINNAVTNGGTTTYGTSATTVYTNGATTVSVTGGNTATIADANAFTATATGNAVGTSTLTTVTVDGVTNAVAVNSDVLSAVTIADSLKGSAATVVTNAPIAGTWTAEAAHTIALTLSGDTNTATEYIDATATALTIGDTGATGNNILIDAAKATSLTINNAAALTFAAGDTMSTTASDKITATGSGSLNLGNTTGWTGNAKLSMIDASAATGAVTAEINGSVTAFKGGAGNDVVTVDTGASQSISGGAGTNTVILTNTAATYNPLINPTGPISADFTNFQNLELAGAAVTGNYDVSSFSNVLVGATGGATVLQNAGAGEGLSIIAAPTGGITYALKADTASDALTVTVGVDGSTKAGITAGTVTTTTMGAGGLTGIETVTVNSVGSSAMTGNHTITLTDTHASGSGTTTLNVTGDAAVAVTDAAGSIAKITVTNTGATDVSAVVAPAAGITITGGAGALTASTNTANTAITSADSVTTGAGGGTITIGGGGAGGLAGSTGSENVNLSNSSGVRDTIVAPDAPVAGDGARGIIAGFGVTSSGATSDVLTLTTAVVGGNQSLVNNIATVTGYSGATYSVSDGVFTLLSGAPAGLAELQDIKLLVDGVTGGVGGGQNKIGAVTIAGTTYVVSSGNAAVGASMGAPETALLQPTAGKAEAQAAVMQLSGVSGITGFGQATVGTIATGASNTIMLSNLALAAAPNTGSATPGSTNTYVDNGVAHDALSVTSVNGVTNNYSNMAAWAQLDLGGTSTGGIVTVTQVGSGDTLVLHGLAAGATLDSLTFSNDVNLVLDSTAGAFTIKSLVDATNTVTEIDAASGANNITIGGITDTALTTIDGSAMTGGTLTLGSVAALAQNSLTVKVGGGAALVLTASGNGDTITGSNVAGGDTIVATGSSNTITDGGGANHITANGAADTITVGSLANGANVTTAQTIHASGAGDTITFSSTGADGVAFTYTAASTVDGGSANLGIGSNDTVTFGTNGAGGSQTVVLTGDVTGGTSASYVFTTLKNVVVGGGDSITLHNAGIADITAGATLGASQVNVAGAASLAAALDLAAATAAMSQQGLGAGKAAGYIPAGTGVADWFQYGGNTYIVEAVNTGSSAATHTALGANDIVVEIVGLVNLSGSAGTFGAGHTITL